MKKKIILHGYLADLHPHDIEVEASTVAEALRSLENIDALASRRHHVKVKGVDSEIALYAETEMEEVHVYPQTQGAGGRGGLLQILIGIVFVAVAFINPAFLGALGISQTTLFLAGGLMIAGGLLQMLMPVPEMNNEEEGRSGILGGGSQNTVRLGTPITLAYGYNKLGGHYLSFDVDAKTAAKDENDNYTPADPNNVVVEYDKTPVQAPVILPRYSSPVAGPSNVPVTGWIR